EHVGDLPLIDEKRHLRLAHGELRAVLDLEVLHRKPVGENSVTVLGPMNDVDELLPEKVRDRHVPPRVPGLSELCARLACPRGCPPMPTSTDAIVPTSTERSWPEA